MVAISATDPLAPYSERELLHAYAQASPDIVRRGREWYPAARAECEDIARTSGHTVAQVAAVLAITSPDTQLGTNLSWTRAACHQRPVTTAGKYPGAQLPKVRAALADTANPGQYALGPKVAAFYRAIIGDEDALVIDRWAVYAAGCDRSKVPGAKTRRIVEQSYRAAATRVGENVRDFQAIVWTVVRESTPSERHGLVPKRSDITA